MPKQLSFFFYVAGLLLIVSSFVEVSCTTQQKMIARTVNDAATIACHAALRADAEKQGLNVEDLCAAKEVLQPFLDAILSAQKVAAPRAGLAPPAAPGGG